jgi:hypothetical protein
MPVAAVQRVATAGPSVASLSVSAATTPTAWAAPAAGNLLVVTANSDATVTMTTAGFTAGPSVIDGNGAYLWWKVADGTESTITVTPGSAAHTAMTACEYSGVAASPFDVQNSSLVASSNGTSTVAAAITTTQAGDLIVAAALLHGVVTGAPSAGSWSGGLTNHLSPSSGSSATGHAHTFYGDLLTAGAAGTFSTVCTWTTGAFDRQHIIAAFKEAPAATTAAKGKIYDNSRSAINRASRW